MTLKTLFAYNQLFNKEFLRKIFAHKDDNGNYETIEEHAERTLAKAHEIISKLRLDSILTQLNDTLYGELKNNFPVDEITEQELDSSMKTLLATIIYLHDLGKINKKYQSERLGNSLRGIEGFENSHHSSYGHMLINQLLFSEKQATCFRKNKKLAFCAIVFGTIVNRHHTQ